MQEQKDTLSFHAGKKHHSFQHLNAIIPLQGNSEHTNSVTQSN